jgi:haloalkane dehalogenase
MEFIWPIPTWLDVAPNGAEAFRGFRSDHGRQLLIEENRFIEQVLLGGIVRELTDEEMRAYREPFLDRSSREPLYRFPNELPIAGAPADTWAMAEAYQAWLLETETPKLFFWAEPGSIISPARRCLVAGPVASLQVRATRTRAPFRPRGPCRPDRQPDRRVAAHPSSGQTRRHLN